MIQRTLSHFPDRAKKDPSGESQTSERYKKVMTLDWLLIAVKGHYCSFLVSNIFD